MSEPTSSGVAAFAGFKFALSTGVGAAIGTLVVMLFTQPRSKLEWAQALICSVASSLGGGSYIIVQYSLLAKADQSWLAALAIGSVYFACALPGWTLVRWAFNWINKREGKDLSEVAQDAADQLRRIKKT